jgi:hypothetical protein
MTGLLSEEGKRISNMRGVVFVDPLLEEPVRDLQFHIFSLHGEKVDRFDPDVEILLTDPFL